MQNPAQKSAKKQAATAPAASTGQGVTKESQKDRELPTEKPKPPAAPGRRTEAGLVGRPLGKVLDMLPVPVAGRVRPLYTNYAEPLFVAKVDGALGAVANKGSRVLGGARAKFFKVKTAEDLESLNRPGLLIRALGACERGLDKVLPPAPQSLTLSNEGGLSNEEEDLEELSAFRRLLRLADTFRMRAYIHSEVKYIMMKVKAKVWFDLNVTPPYKRAAKRVRNARLAVLDKKARTQAYVGSRCTAVLDRKARTQAYVAKRCASVRRGSSELAAAGVAKLLALKGKIKQGLGKAKEAAKARLRPATDALKQRLKPLTKRLGALVQKLWDLEVRVVSYFVEKKRLLGERVRARTQPLMDYFAGKYAAVRTSAAKRRTSSVAFVKKVFKSALGTERSAKVQGLMGKYVTMISASARAHA